MKELIITTGGRPRYNDDFYVANDTIATMESLYSGHGNFILSGCKVSGSRGNASVSAGVVYVGGKILQLSAYTGVNFNNPVYIVLNRVESDPRLHQIGGLKNCMVSYFASLTNIQPVNQPFMELFYEGSRRVWLPIWESDLGKWHTDVFVLTSSSGVFEDVATFPIEAGVYYISYSGNASMNGSISQGARFLRARFYDENDGSVYGDRYLVWGIEEQPYTAISAGFSMPAYPFIFKNSTILKFQVARWFGDIEPQTSQIGDVCLLIERRE